MHSEHYIPIFGKSNAFKYSFIQETIRGGNKLPQEVFTRMESAEHPIRTFAAVVKRGASC